MIVLLVVSLLIYFGLAQRVLDRLRLSDRAALAMVALLIVGSFITIPLATGRYDVSINVGGALIPIALAGYLLVKAGTTKEWIRAIFATLITAGVIYGTGIMLAGAEPEPGGRLLGVVDALWAYPLIAGLVAYLAGRSRRSAFIAATLGIVLVDIGYFIWLTTIGAPAGTVAIGGAGIFDAVVIAGIFAVLLAEAIGEIRERLQGGPEQGRPEPLMEGLRKPVIDEVNAQAEDSKTGDNEEVKGGEKA